MIPDPQDWREILRAAHNDPIDAAHYTALRARVLSEIDHGRRPWRLGWLFGAGAILALLLLLLPVPRPQLPPLPRIAAPGHIAAADLAAAVPSRPPHRPKVQVKRVLSAHREPLTIQLQTSDPNIVIYWIAD